MAFGTKTNEREGTRAVLRNAPGSASKVRVVLDLIRGLDIQSAREVLEFCERDAATIVGKLLDSAIANAEHNDELVGEELFVSACYADEARTAKRFKPRARGRAGKIFKRSAHITVIVSRLPEDRLARIKAKAEAAQTERRSRRGSAATPERGRRARVAASQKADSVVVDEHEGHDHEGHDHDEPVIPEAAIEDVIEQETEVAEPVEVIEDAVAEEAAVEAAAGEVVAEAPAEEAAPAEEPKSEESE
ncbi:MAG: large subunit ribosomal protein [Actinomycetota bacterium]|jgi:large subunit ribosomal protein L22